MRCRRNSSSVGALTSQNSEDLFCGNIADMKYRFPPHVRVDDEPCTTTTVFELLGKMARGARRFTSDARGQSCGALSPVSLVFPCFLTMPSLKSSLSGTKPSFNPNTPTAGSRHIPCMRTTMGSDVTIVTCKAGTVGNGEGMVGIQRGGDRKVCFHCCMK